MGGPEAGPATGAGRVLLTGATGYIGGRLLAALEARGIPVRCLCRRPEFLASRVGPLTEVAGGDVLDPASMAGARSASFSPRWSRWTPKTPWFGRVSQSSS